MSVLSEIRHFDVTAVFARNMAAMRYFYGTVMEFPLKRELGPQWVEYKVGSSLLVLTERGLMFDDASTPDGALSLMLAFRVTPGQVNECAKALETKGVSLLFPPTDQPWAHRTIFFRDPDGNIIEIYADI